MKSQKNSSHYRRIVQYSVKDAGEEASLPHLHLDYYPTGSAHINLELPASLKHNLPAFIYIEAATRGDYLLTIQGIV